MTRPPHLVIPGLPPPSSPASLLRHPRPRSGTYALVILATDPKPIIPPSFRPPSRYPWAGRGNHHNRHPPPTPPHPNPVIPAPEPEPRGRARKTPLPSSPGEHRRAGVGRYPGDGRGYPLNPPNVHVPSPGEHRRAGVTLYPDTGPQPRGSGRTTRLRQKPRPTGPGHKRV